ncbi:MAG: hypothetical protein NXI30_14195 [bacterium]|nr:hypothetical protein [bacterium]
MRRHAPHTTVLVSVLVLTSYVAAAFVDCERPVDAGLLEAARLAAGVDGSPHGPHAMSVHGDHHARPKSGHGDHDAHAMSGHGDHDVHGMSGHGDHDVHAMSGHGDHAEHAGMDPVPTARPVAPPCHPEAVLVPTCPCGCSETRGLVGGTLARLGVTIPAVHVAALPAEVVIDGRSPIDLRLPAPFVVDDPIPI